MNKIGIFLDKNYFYIIIFLILATIFGSIFVLRNKNEIELTKKVGNQYLSTIMSNAKGDFNDEQLETLNEMSKEKNNFGTLASILSSSAFYKKNDFDKGDKHLLSLINDNSKNKILHDYALYLYAHNILARFDLQKFSELLPKLSDKSTIFFKNNIELIATYYIYKQDYKNAIQIIDDNINSMNENDTLKSRMNDIKSEAQNALN